MAGKYSKFRGKYPKAPVDAKWQAKVNTVRTSEVEGKEIAVVAKEYDDLRLQKDKLEEELSDLNIEIAAREQFIASRLEATGMEKITLASGTSLSIKDSVYSSEADRPTFIQWLKKTGQEALLSVHYGTLNAMVCDCLTRGQPIPPGIKVFMKQGLNWRNPNRRKEGEDSNGEE